MNEKYIRKYAQLMKELELTAIEISDDQGMVRLEQNLTSAAPQVVAAPAAATVAPAASEASKPAASASGSAVTSPMVGVFYAAPAENADPFVKVGDSVKAGDVLCIIEAMKLMNEIPADKDGTILEICVENGQVVEFGQPLFIIG